MTTIPDHLIDKALAAGVRARAERAVALDRTESLDLVLVTAALAAVADDLRDEGAREALTGLATYAARRSMIAITDRGSDDWGVVSVAAQDYMDDYYPEKETDR